MIPSCKCFFRITSSTDNVKPKRDIDFLGISSSAKKIGSFGLYLFSIWLYTSLLKAIFLLPFATYQKYVTSLLLLCVKRNRITSHRLIILVVLTMSKTSHIHYLCISVSHSELFYHNPFTHKRNWLLTNIRKIWKISVFFFTICCRFYELLFWILFFLYYRIP